MRDEEFSHLEGQLSVLSTTIVLLARALLPEEEFTEFRSQLEELVIDAAEETSPLRQARVPHHHGLDHAFLLGISERAERLLHDLASLKAEEK